MKEHSSMNDAFAYAVLSVVEEIPCRTAATYGQIAKLIGKEKNARLVARVLSHAEYYGTYPCHRVVNHAGRIAPAWPEQAMLLIQEGCIMKDNTHVDLKCSGWNI